VLIFICVIQTYFRVKTELKVIGHFVRRPYKRYFKACCASADSDKNARKLRIERGIQLPEKYKKNLDARNVEVLPFFQVVE
jgi:hypothetical protein